MPPRLSANATQFTMNTGVAYGSAYAISVQTPPAGLVCSVSNGAGTMGAADVASISIACALELHSAPFLCRSEQRRRGPIPYFDPGQRRELLWIDIGRGQQQWRHDLRDHAERDRERFLLLRRHALGGSYPGQRWKFLRNDCQRRHQRPRHGFHAHAGRDRDRLVFLPRGQQ